MKVARGCPAFLVVLVAGGWLAAYADQWIVRWRAEKLLADIDSIKVNRSTQSEAEILIAKWRKNHEASVYCGDDGCNYATSYSHILPPALRGYPDDGVKNYLPRLMDHIGLRSESAGASVSVKNGIVTGKSFEEYVALPIKVWFDRGGAYVPDLFVSSRESAYFRPYEGNFTSPGARRVARHRKGPYGLIVTFVPAEDASERAALMDFRMQCFTRLSPCLNEREILPEGAHLLEQTLDFRRAANAAAEREYNLPHP